MSNFSNSTSKFKMVIYFKDTTRKVFYSLETEEKKSDTKALQGMINRLLGKLYRKTYNTALIYNMQTGLLIDKYVRGVRVSL